MASIKPRGKRSDQWYIRLRFPGNKGRDVPFDGTRAEADKEARRLEGRKLDGRLGPPSDQSVKSLLERYLKRNRNIRMTTRRGYEHDIQHLTDRLGHLKIDKLLPDEVADYVADCLTDGNRETGAELSTKTVRNRLGILFAAIKAQKDPMALASLKEAMPSWIRPEQEPLTRLEHAAWRAALAGSRDEVAFALATGCGLRRGEIAGLRRSDVDLGHRVLQVRRSMWLDGGVPHFDRPKSIKGRRPVTIPDYVAEILRSHFATQDRITEPDRRRRDDRLVWARPDGTPYDLSVLTDLPERTARKHGLRRVRFHDFRHTYATFLLESGVSINKVSRLLGHHSVTFTVLMYGHVTALSDRRAREVLDELFAEEEEDDTDEGLAPVA